jgi:two-component system response regulator FlrC
MNAATILIVEDDAALREALAETLAQQTAGHGLRVLSAENAEQALARLADETVSLVLADVRLGAGMDGRELLARIKARHPYLPVLLMTAYATVRDAVEAIRAGASDYIVKPFDPERLVEKIAALLPVAPRPEDAGLIARDPRMRELVALAARVAKTDATVMLSGESGAGKEVLARYIHRTSARAGGPFVAVNCAAIPENMLEAVLFGYEKGAFTGAVQATPGKFEQAQGGTLLLDEVTEMGPGLQAKLLRVLQEKEVERLGGRRPIALDVRVLATTNRVLREEVAAGRFREDLFYRLNVFPLHLPPLRERREDILPLAEHLLAKHARAANRTPPRLSEAACARLLAHPWPGNVRELDNLMQRALILQPLDEITEADLRFETVAAVPPPPPPPADRVSAGETLGQDLRAREQQLILEALRAEGGRRAAAAARLGISERTLRYKLARMREAGIPV